jgi:hypothetical protein
MTTNFFSPLLFWDPGSGKGKNQDPGSGINIPDPQHWYPVEQQPSLEGQGLSQGENGVFLSQFPAVL